MYSMSTLLEKQIKINRIVTTSVGQARAIDDPARSKILEILYHKKLNAEQISKELNKVGHKKAVTTIRHHLDILKVAGLIEIVKIEESRGAITKFYGTATKFLGYEIPDDFDSKYSSVIKSTSTKLEKLVKNITPKTNSKTKQKLKNSKNYNQYVLMEIINRAIVNVLEKPNNKK